MSKNLCKCVVTRRCLQVWLNSTGALLHWFGFWSQFCVFQFNSKDLFWSFRSGQFGKCASLFLSVFSGDKSAFNSHRSVLTFVRTKNAHLLVCLMYFTLWHYGSKVWQFFGSVTRISTQWFLIARFCNVTRLVRKDRFAWQNSSRIKKEVCYVCLRCAHLHLVPKNRTVHVKRVFAAMLFFLKKIVLRQNQAQACNREIRVVDRLRSEGQNAPMRERKNQRELCQNFQTCTDV